MGLTRAEKIKFVRETVAKFKPVVSERERLERQMRGESPELSEADVLIHDLRQSAFETMIESLVPRELDELFEVVHRLRWGVSEVKQRNLDSYLADLTREQNRTYNQPAEPGVLHHWSRIPNWTVNQFVALSLDRDPNLVSVDVFTSNLQKASYFGKLYFSRRQLVLGSMEEHERTGNPPRLTPRKYASKALLDFAYAEVDIIVPARLNELMGVVTEEHTLPSELIEIRRQHKSPKEITVASEPHWLLEPAAGGKWSCGLEGQTKLINKTQGLVDLRYAVQRKGEDCDPREYYSDAAGDTDGVPQRNSAPDALDPKAVADIKEGIADYKSRIEVAKQSGDLETVQDINEKLQTAQKYLLANTKPGGQSRKIYKGDASARLISQMRGRKDTVVKNLRNVGLNDMADHINDHYVIRTLRFSYTGSSLKKTPPNH